MSFADPLLMWPIAVAVVFLVVAGVVEYKTYRVPNSLSFSALGFAVLVAVLGSFAPIAGGSVSSCFAGATLAGGAMLGLYAMGGLGAGCVKAHAAFGGLIGCAVGITSCAVIVVIATIGACCLMGSQMCWTAQKPSDDEPQLGHGQVAISIGSIAGLLLVFLLFARF